jgi:glutamate dehydrogenase/leucine dehydrogenase
LFSLYGETLSRLPGKVFGCDVTLNINWIEKLADTTESYRAKRESCVHMGKTLSRSPSLACQARSRYTGKLLVSYMHAV